MSDKIEQAAEETVHQAAERLYPFKSVSWDHNWNKSDSNMQGRGGFYAGVIWKELQLQSTIATLQAENETLKQALTEILHQTKHRTVSTVPACNRIATEALTPKI
jgi:hypothetical protein